MPTFRIVTKNLIIINVLLFMASKAIPQLGSYLSAYYVGHEFFRPWQIITHMFMHGGMLHLGMNMLGLFMLGNTLESYWGPKKFLQYYLFCGLGAFGLHELVTHLEVVKFSSALPPDVVEEVIRDGRAALMDRMNYVNKDMAGLNSAYNSGIVGASGCVFGLLIAFGMMFPKAEFILFPIPIPVQARYLVIGYAVIELLLAYLNRSDDNVAHYAHIGGFVFGYILLKYWQRQGKMYSS
jgi:membrane associated rhomboid family serine protease